MRRKGRAIVQVPLEDLLLFEPDTERGMLKIVLEGEQYPPWHPGELPMVILGGRWFSDEDLIVRLCDFIRKEGY